MHAGPTRVALAEGAVLAVLLLLLACCVLRCVGGCASRLLCSACSKHRDGAQRRASHWQRLRWP